MRAVVQRRQHRYHEALIEAKGESGHGETTFVCQAETLD
jgi:hypothetical protein